MALTWAQSTAELARLTEAAKMAAEQGQWDLVDACYRERGALLETSRLPPQEANRLLAIDRQIQERAMVAQAALAASLREPAFIRRRLKGLRQGIGAASSDSWMILLEA
jgi:hypothetical protein